MSAAKDLAASARHGSHRGRRDAENVLVYILANRARTLYIEMTNDLERRMFEHKTRRVPGFAARYEIDQLVYYEERNGLWAAIEREKELKGWSRVRKSS